MQIKSIHRQVYGDKVYEVHGLQDHPILTVQVTGEQQIVYTYYRKL